MVVRRVPVSAVEDEVHHAVRERLVVPDLGSQRRGDRPAADVGRGCLCRTERASFVVAGPLAYEEQPAQGEHQFDTVRHVAALGDASRNEIVPGRTTGPDIYERVDAGSSIQLPYLK